MQIEEPHGLYHAFGRAHFAYLGYRDNPYLWKFWKKRISFQNYYPSEGMDLNKSFEEKYKKFILKKFGTDKIILPPMLIYAYVRLVKDII